MALTFAHILEVALTFPGQVFLLRPLVLILAFSVPAAARGQSSGVEGLVLGLAAEVLHSDAHTLQDVTGAGVGALIGVGAFRHFVVTFGAGVAGSDAGLLGHAGFGVRAYVPLKGRIRPYAEAGFMSHGRELADERLALGNGFTLAVGSELFWLPHRSMVVSVTGWSGRFDEIAREPAPIDLPARNLRVSMGVHLRAPRAAESDERGVRARRDARR